MTAQLALFAGPRARVTDPATSQAAADTVARYDAARLDAVVAAVQASRTATADDVHAKLGGLRSTIHRAVSRAARRGLIVPCGVRASITGRSMTVYRVA
jgi:hypothetical protein